MKSQGLELSLFQRILSGHSIVTLLSHGLYSRRHLTQRFWQFFGIYAHPMPRQLTNTSLSDSDTQLTLSARGNGLTILKYITQVYHTTRAKLRGKLRLLKQQFFTKYLVLVHTLQCWLNQLDSLQSSLVRP